MMSNGISCGCLLIQLQVELADWSLPHGSGNKCDPWLRRNTAEIKTRPMFEPRPLGFSCRLGPGVWKPKCPRVCHGRCPHACIWGLECCCCCCCCCTQQMRQRAGLVFRQETWLAFNRRCLHVGLTRPVSPQETLLRCCVRDVVAHKVYCAPVSRVRVYST